MEMDKKNSKKAEKSPKIESKTDTSKFYELGFILVPSLSVDDVQGEVKKITDLFVNAGGEMISGEAPVLIDLAYEMVKVIHAHREKCTQGYFGWMKFEIETEKIQEIKKALDLSETILRYLLITTVAENTLLNGKMNLVHGDDKGKKFDEELAEDDEDVKIDTLPEASEGDLDKTIDDLVVA